MEPYEARAPGVTMRFWALLVLVFLATSCGTPTERPPNIILVVLDTVRDDFVGVDVPGYPGEPVTPWVDRLASEGTNFVNAWSNAPWTVPSHASILTGRLPSVHECTGYNWKFAYDGPTIAERLNDAGYRTMAFYSNPWLSDRLTGVLRGFEEQYVDPRLGVAVISAPTQGGPETVSLIARWLDSRDDDQPFLMFVNFLEAHLPYAPPQYYRQAYLPEVTPYEFVPMELADSVNARLKDVDDVDWEHVRRMYAGDVNAADSLLGMLVGLLKEHGLYDDSVIIVASDHGELQGEHGFFEHQFGVYRELIAVPLVVRAPGRLESGVRTDPAMLTDIYATILDAAGLPPDDLPNSRSLFGSEAAPERPLIAEYAGPNAPLRMKLHDLAPDLDEPFLTTAYVTVRVEDVRLTMGSDGSHLVRDLSDAPMSARELEAEGRELSRVLDRMLSKTGSPRTSLDAGSDLEERLRSLGYIN